MHDFGSVVAGDSVKHTFTLKNVGEGTLSITQVRPQCGCTAASNWAKEVKPGGTWELPLILRTTGYNGKVRKPITVTTNDPKMQSFQFALVGEIQARFKIEPRQNVYLVMTDPDAVESQTLTITNQIEKPTVFTSAQSSSASFATELREVEKGKVYELVVKTVPPLKGAVTRATIQLKTENKDDTPLTIQAHAAVQPRITAGPNQLHIHTPAPRDTKRLI
ncbi:MAG: DUF1573 domain-containing protein, partial [Phycisphaerae bacterium]|nr:DUF1573 domain-containing protein [Phycisphaerae bacterium]